MVSKTRLLALTRRLDADGVLGGLAETPALRAFKDPRGRNWLHLACAVDVSKRHGNAESAVQLAKGLLQLGFDINKPAFTEGAWHATPLWYAVARGVNLPLVQFLLESGASPNHCLWAAAYNQHAGILDALIAAGAPLEAVVEDETALFHAMKYQKYQAAERLLAAGASPDFQDNKGRTALHRMLERGDELRHIKLFLDRGANTNLPDKTGKTVAAVLQKKRDPALRALVASET